MQGETPAARRNGAYKRTVKGRGGESSRLPDNEPMTGTLEHRASRSADRLVLKGETREGGHRERSAKEKTAEKEPATIGQCGAQGWPSNSKELKRESEICRVAREVTLEQSTICKDGTDMRSQR